MPKISVLLAAACCMLLWHDNDNNNNNFASALPLDASEPAVLRAGAAKVNTELPVGIPLAGYNHGDRRVKHWPLPQKTKYTTFMTPSVGEIDPIWVKALVIEDGDHRKIAWATFDGIGMDGTISTMVGAQAAQKGLKVPYENIMFSGSHSHSGPGAVSNCKLWEYAPAMDVLVPDLRQALVDKIVDALLEAENSLKPAKVGIGFANLTTVTDNRRAKMSPYLTPQSIDPNLGVIRVDSAEDGTPIATLWNFAMHGTCYGASNMKTSGDIMGKACEYIEKQNGGVALFVNADAGDIAPTGESCSNAPEFKGASKVSDAVSSLRTSINPTTNVLVHADSKIVDFGKTNLNLTLDRLANCTTGPLCGLCEAIHCDLNLHLGPEWVEETPKFTAFRIDVDGVPIGAVSVPGEPLSELGSQIRSDAASMGFKNLLLCGYTNNHMGYFATPNEYVLGGYESELTFWGINTTVKIRDSCADVLNVAYKL